jgi:hypothetical protein
MGENGKEYSMETVERCEDSYCVDGLTFDQVAGLTGVSISTLKRWSERYDWQQKREDIRRARSAIRTGRVLLHSKLIENCLKTLNPQDAFAVASIDGVVQRAAEAARRNAADAGAFQEADRTREIRTDAEAVAALEEAVQIRVGRLLANPDALNFRAMQDIGKVMEFLKDLRAKAAPGVEAETRKAIDPETLKTVREQIYGLS